MKEYGQKKADYNYMAGMAGLTEGGFVVCPEGGLLKGGGEGFTPYVYFYDNNLNLINKFNVSSYHITIIHNAQLPGQGFVVLGNTDGGEYLTHLFYFDSSYNLLSQRDIRGDIPSLATKTFRDFTLSVLSDGGVAIAQLYTSNVWVYHSPPTQLDFSGYGITSIGGIAGSHFQAEEPTLIKLTSFTATASNRKVILSWTTESEIDNAGFNLYRAESKDGEYVKINPALIPAQGSATQGATYEFVDENVRLRETYWYKLEDIDLNGKSTFHGPVSAMPRRVNELRVVE
ncbi:MAG: hypothetical protein NT096_06665 [Proteobacteria bacterium]|nr:hypothetical protein [Pseudomonadota bacterium]